MADQVNARLVSASLRTEPALANPSAYIQSLAAVLNDRFPDAEKNTPETEWRRLRDIWGAVQLLGKGLIALITELERKGVTSVVERVEKTLPPVTEHDPIGGAKSRTGGTGSGGLPGLPSTPGTLNGIIDLLRLGIIEDRVEIEDILATIAGLVPASLIDAKGDLLVGTADDTIARLGVGADGEVLTADSGATEGVSWQAPTGGGGDVENPMTEDLDAGTFTVTNLATPSASSDAATKGYVDTADALAVPKSLVDAKGDLLTATADDTPARLAVGANGTVLMADSAAPTGNKWAAQNLIDHGSLGGLTDDDHTQYLLKSLLSAKGALISASAASTPLALAVGANKRALVADSAESSGLKWGGGVDQHYFVGTGTVDIRIDGAWAQAALSTLSVTLDRIYLYPFWIKRPVSLDRIGYEVTTGSGAGGKVRLGIYAASSVTDPKPATLVIDSGEFSGADVESTGWKEKTIAVSVVEPGLYWMAFTAGTAAPTVRTLAPGAIIPLLGQDAAGGARNSGFLVTASYAALPSPWSGTLNTRNGAMPQVGVRISGAS